MNHVIFSKIFWLLLSKNFRKQTAMIFHEPYAKETMKCAKKNYYTILRDTPSFRDDNPKLVDIVFTALVAAIYKAGNGKISVIQMDAILTDSMESSYMFRKSFGKENHFAKEWQDKRNLQALLSQQRKYPSDFVCDFIHGETFDEYGITYYQCAIYELMKQEGCPELIPLFCKFDYIMARHMNSTLKRTKTLVTGEGCCDFWYIKN